MAVEGVVMVRVEDGLNEDFVRMFGCSSCSAGRIGKALIRPFMSLNLGKFGWNLNCTPHRKTWLGRRDIFLQDSEKAFIFIRGSKTWKIVGLFH